MLRRVGSSGSLLTPSARSATGMALEPGYASPANQAWYSTTTTSRRVGYASSSDKRVHFGVGQASRIREIELGWPSGTVQTLKDVAAD